LMFFVHLHLLRLFISGIDFKSTIFYWSENVGIYTDMSSSSSLLPKQCESMKPSDKPKLMLFVHHAYFCT